MNKNCFDFKEFFQILTHFQYLTLNIRKRKNLCIEAIQEKACQNFSEAEERLILYGRKKDNQASDIIFIFLESNFEKNSKPHFAHRKVGESHRRLKSLGLGVRVEGLEFEFWVLGVGWLMG